MSASPVFAVVGHPNKGKSSLVATLSQQLSVAISPIPGTTTKSSSYPMKVDGKLLYSLVDTPGFQKPRQALELIRSFSTGADDRRNAIKIFLAREDSSTLFPDECELLAPIVEGAGIIYVVDGAVPYSEEYESELEILRWTGQPRMAVINPIGAATYETQWREALGQYFNVVKVFNPLVASSEKRIELLSAFGLLHDEWANPISEATTALLAQASFRRQRSADFTSKLLCDLFALTLEENLAGEGDRGIEEKKVVLTKRFEEKARNVERSAWESLMSLFALDDAVLSDVVPLDFREADLFSKQSLEVFGLGKAALLRYGAVAGAAAGAMVDVASGGSSLLLGSLLGGLTGATLGYFGSEQVVDTKVLFLSLGRRVLRVGPLKDLNFPHIVLGRIRYLHLMLFLRNHARREELSFSSFDPSFLRKLSSSERDSIESLFRLLRGGMPDRATEAKLSKLLEAMFLADERSMA